LQGVSFSKSCLQWVHLSALSRQPLHGQQFLTVGLDGEKQTGANGFAIQENGASPADTVLTTDMRAGQAEFVSKKIAEKQTRRQ